MIRINLLGEKVDNSAQYVVQMLIFGSTISLAIVLCVALQLSAAGSLSELRDKKSALETKLFELKKITKKVENLESNQKLLKEKLNTISSLKMKKSGPVRVLDDLRGAVPERVWLSSVKQKAGSLEINGMSLDNQTISEFMGNLEKSPFFGKVDLILSTQKEKDKVKLKQFVLQAQLKDPLSMAKKSEVGVNDNSNPSKSVKASKKEAVQS